MSAFVRFIAARLGIAIGATVVLAIIGFIGLMNLPVDAVPDVTNNQVQVVTAAPALAAGEVEKAITLPVERAMAGVPGLKEMRSVSKFGISVVTLIFRDDVDIYFARQQVGERLVLVRETIPKTMGQPQLGPIATGLGEIYNFVLEGPGYTPEELRTTMDWTISTKLRQVRGVIEVVNFGGSVKQFRVTLDPARLAAFRVSLDEVRTALEKDNNNAGGGSIERAGEQLVLRAEARFKTLDEIHDVVVKTTEEGTPLTLSMLAEIDTGPALRMGAMSADGKGEVVAGFVLMLKGENSREIVHRVKAEVDRINQILPKGMRIVPFIDRASFIERTVQTVVRNLLEGAGIVILVLLLTLGSLRAGLLVAGAIPFAMLIAFAGLVMTGMSANVMSLGAVDFGIVVEGAVVVAEAALHAAAHTRDARLRKRNIVEACANTARPVLFAVVIVLLVFMPLGTLEDVEGKMFRPVVISLVFMLAGALFYALVFVPAMAPALLAKYSNPREPWLIRTMRRMYTPAAKKAIAHPKLTAAFAGLIAIATIAPGATLGAEFLPRIFEGDFAIDIRRPVSVSVTQAVDLALESERILMKVPEVVKVVSRTGRTEGSIDPQGPEQSDVFVILKPRNEWRAGMTPEKLVEEMDKALDGHTPSQSIAFTQPIEMRVNDLIAGVKSDVALKIYGDDLEVMSALSAKLQKAIEATPGAADVKREMPTGLPTLRVIVNRERASRMGVLPRSILDAIEVARAGQVVGRVYEGERTFDLVVKISGDAVTGERELSRFPIATAKGDLVPLSSVADIVIERGLFQISREKLRRRLVVEANVRGRDLVGFVADAKQRVAQVQLPPGVELHWGGQFENFTRANQRLTMLVPVALGIIALMLFMAYRSVPLTIVTLLGLPFALGGGLLSLVLRQMPFSIPAMVGFIALAGVSVMSGVVMTTRLLETDPALPVEERVLEAAESSFRPTISTALVAALGFIPMAIATSAGAEVQRPLATVVIGGLIVGVIVSVVAVPALLLLVGRRFKLPIVERSHPHPEFDVPHGENELDDAVPAE
ncbi:MAG: efflux RND transporter permease subunit [Deltaproteobacteria bacterium]|nr:efflux RND transporter permease subunit [Deltaproteobacteria bacterium]